MVRYGAELYHAYRDDYGAALLLACKTEKMYSSITPILQALNIYALEACDVNIVGRMITWSKDGHIARSVTDLLRNPLTFLGHRTVVGQLNTPQLT